MVWGRKENTQDRVVSTEQQIANAIALSKKKQEKRNVKKKRGGRKNRK